LTVEHIVAAVLYRLAHGAGLHAVANMFGIAESTVSVLTVEVCSAVVSALMPEVIRMPSADRLQEVVDGFRARSGLPNCVGAVDGTHVPLDVRPPQHAGPGDYWCQRKQVYSIVMQAVVDSRGLFMDIDVRWPGRSHDAAIFRQSSFGQQFPQMYPGHALTVDGVRVPLYVVADSAYPLAPWCIKRYVAGPHNGPTAVFDAAVQAARVVVENAFSRLKGRWRALRGLSVRQLHNAPTVIAACAVLHNLCEVWDPGQVVSEAAPEPPEEVNDEDVLGAGRAVRDALRAYLARGGGA
jgi:DDE superfamily endonuclease